MNVNHDELSDDELVAEMTRFFYARMRAAKTTTDALECSKFVLELRGIKVNSSGRRVAVSPPVLIELDG